MSVVAPAIADIRNSVMGLIPRTQHGVWEWAHCVHTGIYYILHSFYNILHDKIFCMFIVSKIYAILFMSGVKIAQSRMCTNDCKWSGCCGR